MAENSQAKRHQGKNAIAQLCELQTDPLGLAKGFCYDRVHALKPWIFLGLSITTVGQRIYVSILDIDCRVGRARCLPRPESGDDFVRASSSKTPARRRPPPAGRR